MILEKKNCFNNLIPLKVNSVYPRCPYNVVRSVLPESFYTLYPISSLYNICRFLYKSFYRSTVFKQKNLVKIIQTPFRKMSTTLDWFDLRQNALNSFQRNTFLFNKWTFLIIWTKNWKKQKNFTKIIQHLENFSSSVDRLATLLEMLQKTFTCHTLYSTIKHLL